MGFYIEELPTEFNGITMQEADYLADEFLKDTPCNRMWDAMRALRDFYETVTSEAVDMADHKTENSSEIPNNCETCKHNKLEWYSEICDSCCGNNNHYEPKTEPTGYNLSPVDKDINVRSKDEPQTDKWSHDCIGCGNNDTCEFAFTDAVKICRYINEPQTDCPWK